MIIALFLALALLLIFTVIGVYVERKISAFIQDRVGPDEVGKYGLLQTIADLLKLLQKEDIVPKAADSFLFRAAPFVVFLAIFSGFAVIPLGAGLQGSFLNTGVFFFLAIVSLDVIGILMAGWGANNKYALYGAMRSVAQIISYEIPLGLSILSVIVITQTLDLHQISLQQGILFTNDTNYFLGIEALGWQTSSVGGFLTWNVFRSPLLLLSFLVFFIASLAEANRAPFDLPESESELVGGYHTEYSGFRWSLFMLAEYGAMLLVSLLGVVLFWGSWNTPLPNLGTLRLAEYTTGDLGSISGYAWGAFWLLAKTLILVFLQMLIRWTYPRLRVDQLMNLCWKYLIPFALALLFVNAGWRLLM